MKQYLLLIYLCASYLVCSCQQKKSIEEAVLAPPESDSVVTKPLNTSVNTFKVSTKVDLVSELQEDHSEYPISLKNAKLKLVPPMGLYNPFQSFDTTELKKALPGFNFRKVPNQYSTYEFWKSHLAPRGYSQIPFLFRHCERSLRSAAIS